MILVFSFQNLKNNYRKLVLRLDYIKLSIKISRVEEIKSNKKNYKF